MRIEIVGADRMLKNLNREVMGIKNRTRGGMREAALVVRRRSQELTPVETGNLKASAYTEVVDGPTGPGAEIGYTANYAPYVHEIPAPPATSRGGRSATHRVGQWKFLQTALVEKAREVLSIIAARARV